MGSDPRVVCIAGASFGPHKYGLNSIMCTQILVSLVRIWIDMSRQGLVVLNKIFKVLRNVRKGLFP